MDVYLSDQARLYQVLKSVSHALTVITKARPWDAPKSGQVFHFIRAREAFRSGVRRPFRVLPLLRLSFLPSLALDWRRRRPDGFA